MSHKGNKVNEVLGLPLAREFEAEICRIFSEEEEAVVVMLDVDEFLRINTNFGYDAGDEVIIETGRYFQKHLENEAKLYRYGGDQFAIVFGADYDKETVFLKMETLRAGFDVSVEGEKLTVSVGIAAAGEDAQNCSELIRKAEGAMCRAKRLGRNRVCLAREEKMVTKTVHFTSDQLQRLTKLSKRDGVGEAILLREALDMLLKKYDV